MHADVFFAWMLQRRLHRINVFQIYAGLDFWFAEMSFYRMHSAIRDDVIYCNHCMRHCLCQGFWRSLQLGPDELAI